ncbi:MAG TPA: hypothetical protein VH437_17870 [Terriglobales bacterium]
MREPTNRYLLALPLCGALVLSACSNKKSSQDASSEEEAQLIQQPSTNSTPTTTSTPSTPAEAAAPAAQEPPPKQPARNALESTVSFKMTASLILKPNAGDELLRSKD